MRYICQQILTKKPLPSTIPCIFIILYIHFCAYCISVCVIFLTQIICNIKNMQSRLQTLHVLNYYQIIIPKFACNLLFMSYILYFIFIFYNSSLISTGYVLCPCLNFTDKICLCGTSSLSSIRFMTLLAQVSAKNFTF